jgi:hypothetical protein
MFNAHYLLPLTSASAVGTLACVVGSLMFEWLTGMAQITAPLPIHRSDSR